MAKLVGNFLKLIWCNMVAVVREIIRNKGHCRRERIELSLGRLAAAVQ